MAEIIKGLSFAEYQAIDAVNQSALRPYAKSLRAGVWAEQHQREATASMELGTALHTLILDGAAAFVAAYTVGGPVNEKTGEPYGRTTKAFAAWLEEQPAGITVLTEADHARVTGMAEAINTHTHAGPLFAGTDGERELTIVWTEQVGGVAIRCKARLDYWSESAGVVDIKTTEDAIAESFSSSAARYEYHTQAAWYLHAARRAGLHAEHFGWVAVESKPPHEVAMFRASPFVIDCGRSRAWKALQRYAEIKAGLIEIRDGDRGWTGMELPRWAWESEQDIERVEVL